MNAQELRTRQAPLKRRYKEDPESAQVEARAEARSIEGIAVLVKTWNGETEAGLHPATAGDGTQACSADMLLEALVACAGVTLKSVATILGVELDRAVIRASGSWDARGTLGVSKDAPVGLTDIRLSFDLDTDASAETRARLIELTERYCVIYQTLRSSPELGVSPTP
jgi:uncharacterized OsmC-like protein